MKANRKKEQKEVVSIELPKRGAVTLTVIGDTPYVGTNFAQRKRESLLQEQSGKATTKTRTVRDSQAESDSRRHIKNGVDCIPTEAFRAAMIDTAKDDVLRGVRGEFVRRSISIQGDHQNFITIQNGNGKNNHPGPVVFESVVKLANGLRHIAYRPIYEEWSAKLTIIYLEDRFSQKDVINLLARAGITTGVGDTRRIGGGRFYVAGQKQV